MVQNVAQGGPAGGEHCQTAGHSRVLSPLVSATVRATGCGEQCSQSPNLQGDRQMENKPAQNIQDSFLNTARKEKLNITIYLLSGVKLTGRIRSFDKYSVVLETNNQEQLIFKHAISTVVMGRVPHATFGSHSEGKPAAVAAPVAVAPNTA